MFFGRQFASRLAIASVFAMLIAVAHRAHSQTTGTSRVRELSPGVFFWQGDRETHTQTNVGWIVFEDFVFVVDANFPWGAREILAEIRKTTNKSIRFVFDTHYHADHAYGNIVFAEAGATILSSADCAEESRRKGPRDVENQARGSAESLVHPALGFHRRLVMDDGRRRVELTHVGPAHTRGDAVAYLPKEKILFVGDLAVNWTLGNNVSDVDADPANWVQALDRLSRWDASIVVPGHGAIGTRDTLTGQRDYLAAMLAVVKDAIRDRKSADDVARDLDLRRFQPFGADPRRTASQARSMYRNLARAR
jgi:cyclase